MSTLSSFRRVHAGFGGRDGRGAACNHGVESTRRTASATRHISRRSAGRFRVLAVFSSDGALRRGRFVSAPTSATRATFSFATQNVTRPDNGVLPVLIAGTRISVSSAVTRVVTPPLVGVLHPLADGLPRSFAAKFIRYRCSLRKWYVNETDGISNIPIPDVRARFERVTASTNGFESRASDAESVGQLEERLDFKVGSGTELPVRLVATVEPYRLHSR